MAGDLKLQVLLAAVDKITAPLKRIAGGGSATAKALRAAKDQLKQLDRAQQQVTGFRKLKNEASQTGLAFQAARQRASQLRAEMSASAAPARQLATAYARAERETTRLRTAHIAKLRALKESRSALTAAGVGVKQLGEYERGLRTQIAQTNTAIDTQNRKLAHSARQTARMQGARIRLSAAQGVAGGAMSAGASMGAVAMASAAPVVVAVKQYAAWEDAMLGVAKQMEGARDSAGNLTPMYFQMGAAIQAMSEKLPMASNEIAALVEAGARMGIQGRENLLAFAETTAKAANAFELPANEIGEQMGKIAGLYKVPIKDISELGDAINWLDDNAQSQGGHIIEVLQRMGGVADKLDFRKAAALGSTFLSLGAMPEVAASAANAMVRELSVATMQGKRFQKGVQDLGLDSADLQRRMAVDATGTIISVLEAIKKQAPENQATLATRLFGKEYGDDAAKLANNLGEYRRQLALVQAQEASGSMERENQARLKNLSSSWTLLKNTMVNVAADAGAQLAPALQDIMGMARGGALVVRDWIRQNPQLAGTLLKVAAVGSVVMAAAAGMALAVGSVLGPLALVKFSVESLGIKLGPLAGRITGLATRALPMLTNSLRLLLPMLGGISLPVLAVVGAVAVAGVLIWKYWKPIKAFLTGMWAGISAAAEPVLTMLGAALEPLKPAWDWLTGKVGEVWDWFTKLLTPVNSTSTELQNASDYGRAFGEMLGTVLLAPLKLVTAATDLLGGALRTVFEWSPLGLIVNNWTAITSYLSGLWDTFKRIGGNLMDGLVQGITKGLDKVKEAARTVANAPVALFKKTLGIKSPSRVFAELGGYTMQGLAMGLDRGQALPMRALSTAVGNLRGLGAGLALGAAAASPAMAFDTRAPLSPHGGAASAGNTYHITVNAAAGASGQDIAALVRQAIEDHERQKRVRNRSALNDYGN